jgi:hypothetical protein
MVIVAGLYPVPYATVLVQVMLHYRWVLPIYLIGPAAFLIGSFFLAEKLGFRINRKAIKLFSAWIITTTLLSCLVFLAYPPRF